MVAVALSPQVKEIPLALPVSSAEEHIRNLKSAARASPTEATGVQGSNGYNADAYLPPKEVARSIPCRFYPNCTYAEKCIFYHPPSLPSPPAAEEPSHSNGSANGYHLSTSPQPLNSGNVYDSAQNGYMQQPGAYYGNGYDAQNAEYMHYVAAAAAAQQQGYLPSHLHQQQAAFYGFPGAVQGGYPAGQQQQPQQQQDGYQQQQYPVYYHPQQGGMYASLPPSMYPQHIYPGFSMSPPPSFDQPLSPTSPTSAVSPNGNDISSDPAIISQSPRTSATHPSTSADLRQSPSSADSSEGVKANAPASTETSAQPSGTAGSPTSPNPVNGAYYPVAPVPMPLEALQAQFGNYASPPQPLANGDAQAQPEANFARASLNGQSTSPIHMEQNGDSSKKHERTSSAQMRTLYQTGNAESSAPSAGNAGTAAFAPTNLAGPARLPIHTGPRMHEATNGHFSQGHRRDLSSSSAISSKPPPPSRPFGPIAPNGRPQQAPQRGGAPRPFDPSRPVSACKYFSDGGCRFGDSCFFTHTLKKALPIPGAEDGKTTYDAKAIKTNIGDPEGNPTTMKLRPPGRGPFHPGPPVAGSWNGHAGQQRFQQSPSAYSAPLASGSAQPPVNVAQEAQPKDAQAISASTEEQLQKLISEMPRQINGTGAAVPQAMKPAQVPVVNGHSGLQSPIPATLGRRPPVAPRHQQQQQQQQNGFHAQQQRGSSSQRVPSGENDFPALHNNGSTASGSDSSMQRSSSATRSGPTAADIVAAPPKPVEKVDRAPEAKAEAAAPASQPEQAQHKAASAPAPVPAAAKAPVSWASRAAQAASLPDPPKQKAKPAAAVTQSAKGKEEKKEKKDQQAAAANKEAAKEAEKPVAPAALAEVASTPAAVAPAVAT